MNLKVSLPNTSVATLNGPYFLNYAVLFCYCCCYYCCCRSCCCCTKTNVTFPSIQIQQLLVAMKLEQYQAKFLEQQICGEILAELGEKELEQELGVSSRIHRVRLLKISAGLHRARID